MKTSNILNSLNQLIFYINHSNQKNIEDFPIQVFISKARALAYFNKDFEKLISTISFKIKELALLFDYIKEKIFKETKETKKNKNI